MYFIGTTTVYNIIMFPKLTYLGCYWQNDTFEKIEILRKNSLHGARYGKTRQMGLSLAKGITNGLII